MITQLVQLERQPIQRIQSRQRQLDAEISTLGKLSSSMKELQDFLADMSSTTDVIASSATSSNEDALSATATGEAQKGSFSIKIDSLANSARMRSEGLADSSTEFGEGTLSIQVFGEDSVDIDVAAGESLSQVRDKINAATDLVSASIIDTGDGAYLSMSSAKEGHEVGGAATDALQVSHSASAGADRTFSVVEEASNAVFEVDGLRVERQSNQIDDVLQGLTLNLDQTTTEAVELNVEPDVQKTRERFESFMEKYNAVIEIIQENNEESASSRERALSDMRDVLISTVAPGSTEVSNLASIGIESSRATGELSIDSTTLEDALVSNSEAIASLFGDATNGIAARLDTVLENYTESGDGFLAISKEGLRNRSDRMDTQIERKERAVTRYEERLNRQFTQLETISSEMQSISARFANFAPLL
jgi:flagellar hook-associated protein 2